jgi:hypothetical protein
MNAWRVVIRYGAPRQICRNDAKAINGAPPPHPGDDYLEVVEELINSSGGL